MLFFFFCCFEDLRGILWVLVGIGVVLFLFCSLERFDFYVWMDVRVWMCCL